MKPYPHIYLSPHLDDGVLSCGGRIWQQAQAGERVLVVTVFASAPPLDAPLSPFAQELHARWEHPDDAITRRRDEDLAALARLGAEAAHWPYADCIYRQTSDGCHPYASEEALWGEVHPAEKSLVTELATRITALPLAPGGAIYAPLGVGRHVDHQIVRQAASDAWALAMAEWTPTYYEDFPYAEDWPEVQAALGEGRWQVEKVPLSEESLVARVEAVACYRSQLSTFWAGAAEMAAAVRAFAEQVGDGEPAERYWKPTSP